MPEGFPIFPKEWGYLNVTRIDDGKRVKLICSLCDMETYCANTALAIAEASLSHRCLIRAQSEEQCWFPDCEEKGGLLTVGIYTLPLCTRHALSLMSTAKATP